MNELTNHGDHLTTGANTRAGWLSIIIQPQEETGNALRYKAHGWRHGELVGSSDYHDTPECAAAELVEFADALPAGWCVECGGDLDEPGELCEACTNCVTCGAELDRSCDSARLFCPDCDGPCLSCTDSAE